MVTIQKDSINGYKDNPVSYNLFKQDKPSTNLVIMFPGRGYTVQAPLFHYSTGVFLNKGFDILHVNYDYTSKEFDSMSLEEEISQISKDVNAVIDKALTSQTYENYTLIGKSLGTIALSSIFRREEFSDAKLIWLTPLFQLEGVFNSMLTAAQSGLCIIGDNDSCYIKEKFEQINTNENMYSILIPGTDHSLNYADNPLESISVLKRIITEINNF